MELRPYQTKVVNAIGDQNAIVKMPTGSGKTFVAAEFVLRGLNKLRKREESSQEATLCERAALFLVPTCDLVTQQKIALKKWVGDYNVAEYHGRKAIPTAKFDVLVSTPQAFLVCTSRRSAFPILRNKFISKSFHSISLSLIVIQTLQRTETKTKWFSWCNFFACVFDEVHHVLKDHPYRIIAHGIKAWAFNKVQVVGLSASLTYAVEHKAVEQALANLCHDLSVKKMISPTGEELKRSGYIPQDDSIETMKKPWDIPEGVIPGN